MRKKTVALAVALSFFCGIGVSSVNASILHLAVYHQAQALLNQHFYKDFDPDSLYTASVRGLLSALNDPYTHYLEPAEFKQLQSEQSGSFIGIGVELGIRNQELTVVTARERSPAKKAGLKSGDILRKIDGQDTLEIGFARATSLLLGKANSEVRLSVFRPTERLHFNVSIIRKKIKLPVLESRRLTPNIGYIRIHTFLNDSVSENLTKALLKLTPSSLKALVLDLRDNPGGLLTAAIKTGDLFLKKGLLVQVIDRQSQVTQYNAGAGLVFPEHIPIYLLINQGSASSAEILAGSLQDHQRAILVGEPSFGKSLVQVILPLKNRAGLALSTSKYLTAKGRDIQSKGLTPDIPLVVKDKAQFLPQVIQLIQARHPN